MDISWALAAMLAIGAFVGFVAQTWKGRTGLLWALITFLVEAVAALMLYAVTYGRSPRLLTLRLVAGRRLLFWSVAADLAVGLLMVLAVATLPMRGRGSSEGS